MHIAKSREFSYAALDQMTPQKFDIAIIGAGLIGSSLAYHLTNRRSMSVALLDIDFEGKYSSSELNAGGARVEWFHRVNIELSQLTLDFLASQPDQFGFRQKGYLWLYDKNKWKTYQRLAPLFKSLELPIEELSPQEVHKRVPYIDEISDIAGASFGARDGIFNPNLLKQFFRTQAKQKDCTFIDGAYVKAIEKQSDGVQITYEDLCADSKRPNDKEVFDILSAGMASTQDLPQKKILASRVVNAAGAWASKIAKLYGHTLDCKPVRRQVSIFDCKGVDLSSCGMIVDTSGVYFHAEAEHILAGFATPNEPSGYNFTYEGDRFFEEHIWPPLAHRMSKAQALKHITGWAGLYEVSPDHSAVVGCVDSNAQIYEAHSFSGHGAMQSYGVGLALAELILDGKFQTIDVSALHPRRFQEGLSKLLYEDFHI
ncbi:MAG: FAD-binding oxidoreductase [Deltaproteobacteria bacterium]|nr:FAD-binding oxidoreductase [Deltaproteobacteria bacterium]